MKKFKQYFNSTTIRGRANVAKATFASFAALYLYQRFKRRQNKSNEAAINDAGIEKYSSQDIGSLEEYKCPSCECDQANKSMDERQQLHEATPPLDSQTSTSKPNHNQDNIATDTESIIISSNSKSHYTAKQFKERNESYYSDSPSPDKGSCP